MFIAGKSFVIHYSSLFTIFSQLSNDQASLTILNHHEPPFNRHLTTSQWPFHQNLNPFISAIRMSTQRHMAHPGPLDQRFGWDPVPRCWFCFFDDRLLMTRNKRERSHGTPDSMVILWWNMVIPWEKIVFLCGENKGDFRVMKIWWFYGWRWWCYGWFHGDSYGDSVII